MAWFKADSQMHSHPKIRQVSLEAIGLWTVAGMHSGANSLGGTIDQEFVKAWPRWKKTSKELVSNGLWKTTPTGWEMNLGGELWSFAKRRRQHIPWVLREEIYERDGWKCLACGQASDLSLDHIIPWSLGGPDTFENLQTLCRPCNSKKGAKHG